MCETAEVLCSVAELDGFTGFLETFQHPQDGPSPFCGSSTITQNPTWFAFIAWCDDIQMDVHFTNCTTQPSGYGGAQLAVYTDCTFDTQVDCNETCVGANGTVTVDMNNLTIGEPYYVMLDGCGGSTCDYEIEVFPKVCNEEIEDWNDEVTDNLVVCIGSTENYFVENLIGATDWHWYIDNVEQDITDLPESSIEWLTEGTYELCVDASNICVDVDQNPAPNCVMIFVADPKAGDLDADENPLCPDDLSYVSVNDHADSPEYEQYLIYVNSDGEVVRIIQNDWDEFTWPTCEVIMVYSLNFPIGDDIDFPDLGDYFDGSDCQVYCCDVNSLEIEFRDNQDPKFEDPPDDIMVSCYEELQLLNLGAVGELDAEDNCAEDTEIQGKETVMVDTCLGGSILREWSFMDACGNEAYHLQTITVGELPQATFLNVPADTTLTFQEYQTYYVDSLTYSNGAIGLCGLNGKVKAEIEDTRVGCAGTVVVIYNYTDPCNRQITASQTINLIEDPAAIVAALNYCDVDETGFVTIAQSDLDLLVTSDVAGYTFSYYATQADMDLMTNPLVFPFSSASLPGSQIFGSIQDPLGCSTTLIVNLTIHPLPELALTKKDETCKDDADGVIDISITTANPPYILLQGSEIITTTSMMNLTSGNYAFVLEDSQGCMSEEQVNIEPGLGNLELMVSAACDNNFTGTLSDDDFYSVSFIGEGATGNFNLLINDIPDGNIYEYGIMYLLELDADGSQVILTLEDAVTGCRTIADLGLLTSCSDECVLSLDSFLSTCDPNGTFIDDTDDYYLIDCEVSAINGAASQLYSIYANGSLLGTASYGAPSQFILPANGASVEFLFEDSDDSSCFISEQVTDPFAPCSSLCQIEIDFLSSLCSDNDTSADNDDDIFELLFTVTGVNTGNAFMVTNNGLTGNYNEPFTIPAIPISNGDYLLEVVDADDNLCKATLLIPAPLPCSMPCDVLLDYQVIGPCNDNMTGMIDSDDFYFVEVYIAADQGAGTGYSLEDNAGFGYGPFLYDTEIVVGPFPANGAEHRLILVDTFNENCELELVFSQLPCSICDHALQITADNLLIDCNNVNSTMRGAGDIDIASSEWSGPNNFFSTDPEITVTQPGEYFLTVTFGDGCILTESVSVNISDDKPISNAGQDQILNCENSIVTLSSAFSTLGSDIIVNWLDSDGNVLSEELTLDVSVPGTYGLRLFDNSSQCFSEIDEVEVIQLLSEPVSIIYADPGNILDCFVESITLTYEPQDNTVYEWVVNDEIIIENELTITSEEEVMLIALDTLSDCVADTSILITNLTGYPIISLDEVQPIDCNTGMTCISFAATSLGNTLYSWYDSNNNLISNEAEGICLDSPGIYTVELMDADNNCTNSETFVVESSEELSISLPPTLTLLRGQELTLLPITNVPENELAEIVWETEATLSCYDCFSPILQSAEDSTSIKLTITSLDGCIKSALLIVDLLKTPKIYLPNVLHLVQNELFTVFANQDIKTIDELYIYDRWGNVMFQNFNFPTNDNSESWDGKRNNVEAEQGVYVYYLTYTVEEEPFIVTGTITLIR